MTEHLITIRHVEAVDMPILNQLAGADDHAIIAPTMVVEKGPQIVGYLGTVPAVLIWLDSQRVKSRDSLIVANTYENILRAQGSDIIAVPCMNKSPLKPFLPKIGYTASANMTLFLKNLNPRRA